MKYFFVVGERSGDQHASQLITELIQRDESAIVFGWGGEAMKAAGAEILTFYHEISLMGFWEVVRRMRMLQRMLKTCKNDIKSFNPDVVVLVDFPGFNLRVARFVKSLGIKVCYYISPKIWAWKQNRLATIKACVDQMLVIMPFEERFYRELDFEAQYVGNPTWEQIRQHAFDEALISKINRCGKLIAYLPGSRTQEVRSAINVIAALSNTCKDWHFLVAGVDNVDVAVYDPIKRIKNVSLIYGKTYEVLRASEVAIVTSGTASLEAALLNVPQVVVYKTSVMTFAIAKLLVKVKYVSLVNLIVGRRVVKELIQDDYNAIDVARELKYLLHDEETKKRISEGYSEIRKLIGNKCASENAAKAILALGRS